jgi:DNA-binding NarL/FixJ family response regulator
VSSATIDVAAVDDHPIILDSIARWVSGPDSGIRVVATAATVDSLLAGPGRHAHVVLLDLDLGDGTTAERNVAVIRASGPAVLILAASEKARLGPGRNPRRGARLCPKERRDFRGQGGH